MTIRHIFVCLGLSVVLTACHTEKDPVATTSIQGTLHLCSSCHGVTGNATSPDFPNLAGQQSEYLALQLHAFRDQTRGDPHAHTYMWGMAKHLDDAAIQQIADYFAAQPAASGAPRRIAGDLGQKIFSEGIEAREIPACLGCHGEKAEGLGGIPRLAGQHATYLAEQLGHFRSNVRSNDTMHMNALNLSDDEITAVSDYLAAL